MTINLKQLLLALAIPLLIGFLGSSFVSSYDVYNSIIKPEFAPPSWVFPVVWNILYILMGISSYIVYQKDKKALIPYFIQLILNSVWTYIFFGMQNYLLAFIWIILIIVFVTLMIKEFYKTSKVSAILQLPYLLWLIFACVLSYMVYILN